MQLNPNYLRRCVRGFLVACFAVLMLFPVFQQFTGFPRDRRLGGFRYRVREFPRWTPGSWLRGEFTDVIDTWAGERFGMRGWLVSCERQLRYSVFGQVEASPRAKRALVMGTPPVLYENILLVDALRPPQIAPDIMETFVGRLSRVQAVLNENGMAFLVVLAPNKAMVYPDALPEWARDRVFRPDGDAASFIAALQRHDVPYLDTMSLFRDLSPRDPALIPAHGLHWGHEGAWIALQHTIPMVNAQGVLPEIPVPATARVIMDKPSSMNDELRGQLNLFRSPYSDPVPCAYPVAVPLPTGTAPMLDVLIVGDSFAFTFMDALSRSRLCNSIHLWFYMRSVKEATPSFDSSERRGIPRIGGTGMGSGSLDNMRIMLEDKNLVLFLVTTFNIDKYAWGFDRLAFQLYGTPDVAPLPGADDEVILDI